MEKEKTPKYIQGTGITELDIFADRISLDRNKSLDYYKDIFYQCGKCGTCRTGFQEKGWYRVCPSGEYGKFEAYYLGGKNLLTWAVSSNRLNWTENLSKIFYQCSLCLACTQQCQIPEIHHYAGEWLIAMREEAVKKGLGPMPEQTRYSEHIALEYNPYMEKHKDRRNWLSSNIIQNQDAKLAYFVGCTTSYREQSVAKATSEVLNSIQIGFKILDEEHCCGSPIYMTGQTDQAKKIAESNVEIFKKAGIEKIITSCAGCYRTLKETYPKKFGLEHDIEILHLPEFLLEKLNDNELKFNNNLNLKITYHDPCHIGRHMGIYEPPREVLKKIPGIELIEMPRNRQNAWCCGSGGGVRSAFKDLSSFAANERIEEAKESNVDAIVSCCPFCLNQFKTNIKNSNIKTYDFSEIVHKAIKS
ncbi:MAG: (Fe-S)-binding protein [Promethearchaeota archaeon]|nr:MAG: (Fe-S)-binding protein [Candidatus Lokiarchaeota archaeon]